MENPPGTPPATGPASAPSSAPASEAPIFEGSVSLWLGWRAFLWAGLAEALALGAIGYGSLHGEELAARTALIVGVALFLSCNLMLAYMIFSVRSRRYKITRRLIEREEGLLFRRVDALDASRIKDVKLVQSLIGRMLNIGTIEVYSSDTTDPVLLIEAIPNARAVYEQLRDAVIEFHRQRGIMID